ncbi:MAG: chromosome partitioning protein ParA [Desulfobacteraceae bacterium IS3]|nr:MAG: chromosome partitioning protein ParA [Desulfobacteraceae bacterium IS3]
MSKRISMFNHKGGVSKTTSVYNIGWILSQKNKKVLIVDADPQCNQTSLILGDDFEKYYFDDSTKFQNLKDGVKVAFEGKPTPIKAINCYSPKKAPSLFLIAGHATLSEYDAALTFAQTSNNAITTLQNLPGAFSELLRITEEKYSIDITIIDMNPSLSAINQNLFISSHAFIIPTNPDPFSIMAIETLRNILPRWIKWAKDMSPIFADSAYPLPGYTPKFLGSLIQRFNIRNGRAAKPYRDNIAEIKQIIRNTFFAEISKFGMTLSADIYGEDLIQNGFCLREISDFQGLLPKAHNSGVPIFALTNEDIRETGVVLEGLINKRDFFKKEFSELADKLIGLIDNV